MLRSVPNCYMPRWKLLAEIRKRRQLAMQQQQQQQKQEETFYSELPRPASPQPSQTVTDPTAPTQQVLSLLRQSPNQPIGFALSQALFPPHPEHLVSLLENLQHLPHLALQTLIWSLRQPDFRVSPLLASCVAPVLPLPKPPSVDRFLSDAHAFWMRSDVPLPVAIVDPLLSLYCYASPTLDDILEAFHMMRQKGITPNVNHFNQVMQAAVSKQHNQQVDKAELLFKHMLKNGPQPNATSYNIMIYGFCEVGNTDEAQRLFEEMMTNSLPVNEATFSSLIAGIVKTGDYDKAAWLMQQMRYNGIRPSSGTYALVLQGLCEKGKHQSASSLLNDMHTEGLTVDSQTNQLLISSLAQALGVQEVEAFQRLYGLKQQPEGIL
ncbi:hypothetical protein GOP47_0011987 [Adiantum capillus-veneris]|uniref:Pentatricopeptide repeat-containing protein n=1 Tax=Adiantum capillus-veneris TaxID=13818 RepID=A0A9D4ZFX4_ADICA|nr:hypothetical protein GOP47_0011987 [Adiantum capillus-veneris]